MIIDTLEKLKLIDWDFADYNSQLYPADINCLHWYPGTFVPQIPSILISLFSNENDLVFDPFAGSGITLIEAAKQNRRFFGIELNPYVVNIVKAKMIALSSITEEWCVNEKIAVANIGEVKLEENDLVNNNISLEVVKWFHPKTLNMLFGLHSYIKSTTGDFSVVRKVLFSSILNRSCSQREHYTYITDSCFPKDFIEINSNTLYIEKIEQLEKIIYEYNIYQKRVNKQDFNISEYGAISLGNSKNLNHISDSSVDLIVTSPPYLCVNDYVRSMRLISLFFPEPSTVEAIRNEIGARRKRSRKMIQEEYINDMQIVFDELYRVLKPSSYLCLVLGQGRGKVVKDNLIEMFKSYLQSNKRFSLIYSQARKFKFRRIQVPGIGNEMILIFKKNVRG